MSSFSKRLNNWAGSTGKKGPGYCTICGEFGELTRDHVPPQGCVQISKAVLSRLTMEANGDTPARDSLHIQGGLKFRTLCKHCNNDLLGKQSDPELKLFVDSMRAELNRAGIYSALPRIVRAKANLHLVAKSVIGHVLAAHSVPETVKKRSDLGASEALRQYFLTPEASFPVDWRLYCWPYLSRKQIILRHAAWMDVSLRVRGEKSVYGHVLKFLPFGFWLVHKKPAEFAIDGLEITPTGVPSAEREIVTFDLHYAPRDSYPENPTGNYILLFADNQSSVATPPHIS